jgi:aspartyl protease family protein
MRARVNLIAIRFIRWAGRTLGLMAKKAGCLRKLKPDVRALRASIGAAIDRCCVMQQFAFFAIIAFVLAAVAPRFLDRESAAVAVAHPTNPVKETAIPPRTVSISKGENGHFSVEGLVDGRHVGFLVDTGASVVVLRERDADRLGIHPVRRDYTARMSTANGVVAAAPVEINQLEVGDLLLRNVPAVVLPDEALSQNLLGMSFLSRVHWSYQGATLVLEQ